MHGAHRNAEGWRIPARTLEHVVTASLSDLCRSESRLMDLMSPEEPGIAALTGFEGPGGRALALSCRMAHWKNNAASCMPLSNASASHRLRSS